MTARFISNNGTREVSDREFYTSIFGHPPRTREQVQAEWDAGVERYVKLILSGCEMSSYGNPCVIEAKRRIAERDAAECGPDPLPHLEPRARRVA